MWCAANGRTVLTAHEVLSLGSDWIAVITANNKLESLPKIKIKEYLKFKYIKTTQYYFLKKQSPIKYYI